jgi:hypothetical protein
MFGITNLVSYLVKFHGGQLACRPRANPGFVEFAVMQCHDRFDEIPLG